MAAADDAVDLITWFEHLPKKQTTMTDSEQCANLQWWVPGKATIEAGQKGNKAQSNKTSRIPDVARLRRTRRWIDRQTDDWFGEYRFGTKRNGSGLTTTMLRGGRVGDDRDAMVTQLAEMFLRILQAVRAIESERDRVVAVLVGDLEDMKRNHPLELSMILAIDHSILDLQRHGRLMNSTIADLSSVGIEVSGV